MALVSWRAGSRQESTRRLGSPGMPLPPNESALALLLAALSNGKETSGAQVEPVLSVGSEPHVTLVRKGWFPCSRLPSPVVQS